MCNWNTDTLNVQSGSLELEDQRLFRVGLDHIQVKEVGLQKENNESVLEREAEMRKTMQLLTDGEREQDLQLLVHFPTASETLLNFLSFWGIIHVFIHALLYHQHPGKSNK